MTYQEACNILNISPQAELTEIRKQYRKLMTKVHPDNETRKNPEHPHTAQELNAAYAYLKAELAAKSAQTEHTSWHNAYSRSKASSGSNASADHRASSGSKASSTSNASDSSRSRRTSAWKAPLNPNAYREREILHNVEDYDGTILDTICIARGKYFWKTE